MASPATNVPPLDKLKGRENYQTWKIGMQAYLEYEDLWGCVEGISEYIANARNVTKAHSRMLLAIDPINYVHIQDTKTAKEAWEKLQVAFEGSGLTRKVNLLKTLVSTQLCNCDSIEDYVNIIVTTAHKLNGIGLNVPDE